MNNIKRRSFLGFLSSLPLIGLIVPKPKTIGIDATKNGAVGIIAIDLLTYRPEIRYANNKHIDRLKESIAKMGVMNPVNVLMKDGQYILLNGYHRVAACKCLNLPTIPCVFHTEEAFASVKVLEGRTRRIK